jgi:hypothetical protein
MLGIATLHSLKIVAARRGYACANYLQRTLNRASLEYSCCYANARTVTDQNRRLESRLYSQIAAARWRAAACAIILRCAHDREGA